MNFATLNGSLCRRLQARFDRFPESMTEASRNTLDTLRLRPTEDGAWTGQFTPMVLLYPWLQAQGESALGEDAVFTANEAHVMLLIHAFIDDRLRDGQISDDGDLAQFGAFLLEDAKRLLLRTDDEGASRRAEHWGRISEAYRRAQSEGYLQEEAMGGSRLSEERIQTIAGGRGALGLLATSLLFSGEPNGDACCINQIEQAFWPVATGLQWMDDIEDWREDLDTGDENLLLVILKEFTGLVVYAHPVDDARYAEIGRALIRNGLFEFAAESAARCYRTALRHNRAANNKHMCYLLDKRLGRLPFALSRALGDARSPIAESCPQ